jgi:hypothetical protein
VTTDRDHLPYAALNLQEERANMSNESKYIANADEWTQSKSTAGNPNANPEEFAEFANQGDLPSKNKAEQEGAKERVERPSVAKGKEDTREMQEDAEELGDPEAD